MVAVIEADRAMQITVIAYLSAVGRIFSTEPLVHVSSKDEINYTFELAFSLTTVKLECECLTF